MANAFAWGALALIPLGASSGWVLRRLRLGRFNSRMRPHFVLGYGALVVALVHGALSLPAMGSANATGIWFAAAALGGVGLQAFVGTNLQSPGAYRLPLRRWHMLLFFAALTFAIAHVGLNGPIPVLSMDR